MRDVFDVLICGIDGSPQLFEALRQARDARIYAGVPVEGRRLPDDPDEAR